MTNTKSIHIRNLKPGFAQYKNMDNEFRPYLMFTNMENYQNEIVNTDRLGFRKTFYRNKLVGIDEIANLIKQQNIIVGGSTAFSMGSTSDKKTIHSFLTSMGKFCYSLGIRAGTSHQELLSFIKFKQFFPRIKNIIILSGLNDVVLAADKNAMYYNDFGGLIGAESRAYNFWMQASSFQNASWILGRNNFFYYVNALCAKFKILRFFFTIFFSNLKTNKYQKKIKNNLNQNYSKKLNNIKKIIENDLHTWSIIQKQMKVNIIYLFQPVITWTKRKHTQYERDIIRVEKSRFLKYFEKNLTTKKVYLEQSYFIKKICKKYSIKFFDLNHVVLDPKKNKDFFVDFAHLSDYGNLCVAKTIYKIIK
jgi:hypothetical protein